MKHETPSDTARNGWWRGAILTFALLSWQLVTLAQDYAPGACSLVPNSKTCVDSTPCKTAATGEQVCLAGFAAGTGGFNVPQTCWQYSYQYACAGDVQDTCGSYENNPACSVVGSTCQDTQQPSGTCDSWNFTYSCQTSAAQTTQQVVCTNGLFNSSLFPTPTNTSNTFATGAIAQEILREAQVYSNAGTEIFQGEQETCRKGYAGLQNCCKTTSGGESNSVVATLAMGAAAGVVKYYGSEVIDWASMYMYDAMYDNGLWTAAMNMFIQTEYAYGTTVVSQTAASGFGIGAYGFTYSTVNTAGQGVMGADTMLFGDSADGFLMFNPYTLVIALVIMYLESLTQCSQEEQLLSMHRGSDLSVYVSESCTSSFLGVCLGYTDTYCSFNSVLAKIINQQGKVQLGLPFAGCSGFTLAQLGQLNFSTMNFSEFTASLMSQANNAAPTSAGINQAYTPLMQGSTGGSAQTGTMVTGSNGVGGVASTTPPAANPNLPTYPASP
jgi:conjugal transfer mating pair stabilization protein TraN